MSGAACGGAGDHRDRISPASVTVTTTTTTTTAAAGNSADGAALRAAAAAGDTALCCRLLDGQLPLRSVRFTRDELGRNALHLAASGGHAPVLRLLLGVAAPRELDSPDGAGCTALQRAAADGHEEVVRLLLARGADIDTQDSVHGNTALHEAAWKGYSRTVALLCQQCLLGDTTTLAAAVVPTVNPTNTNLLLHRCNAGGFTPLHLCCQNGHNQSCRELLLAGCDPDLQNNYGDTALHTAARYGHAGVTRILISAQCRVSEQNKNGDTALHIAAAMGRRKLTRILLQAGCSPAVRNKQRETARDIAARKCLQEIITILDEHGGEDGKKTDKKERGREKGKEKDGKTGKRSKSKVRFDGKNIDIPDSSGAAPPTNHQQQSSSTAPNTTTTPASHHWSPYGCHYYPDPDAFPQPRLDSLPHEPLKRGEQYYLDLAGNICKGPVGVGYTCYCAPLFRHLEARLERDRRELQRAHLRLGQRVAGLEQRMQRRSDGRRSERIGRTANPSSHRAHGGGGSADRIRTSSVGGGARSSTGVLPAGGGVGGGGATVIGYRTNSGCVDRYDEIGGTLTRSKSLEQVLDAKVGGWEEIGRGASSVEAGGRLGEKGLGGKIMLAGARSMDDLDPMHSSITVHQQRDNNRPTVKELVARIQRKQQRLAENLQQCSGDLDDLRDDLENDLEDDDCSESSDDEAQPASIHQPSGPMGEALFLQPQPSIINKQQEMQQQQQPRSRLGMYSPTHTIPNQTPQQSSSNHVHLEPIVRIRSNGTNYITSKQHRINENNSCVVDNSVNPIPNSAVTNIPTVMSYGDVNARFAKLRVLDNAVYDNGNTAHHMHHHHVYNVQHHLATGSGDRDTNNDSGYSTKVYGSSKGNSPSLSGGQLCDGQAGQGATHTAPANWRR